MTGPLTSAEIAVLRSGGIDPIEEPLGAVDANVELEEMLENGLSVAEAAKLLDCSPPTVRWRIKKRALYGIRSGRRRLPFFQFAGRAAVPGLEQVLATLPVDLHPVGFARWFTSPDVDLVVGVDETPVSPRDWLLGGGEAVAVARSSCA